jgi:hypothetical protein
MLRVNQFIGFGVGDVGTPGDIGGADIADYQPVNLDFGTEIVAVGAPAAFDERIREIGNVLYDPTDTGEEYKLVYTGYDGAYDGNDTFIGYAYSSDGVSWSKGGKLTLGADRNSEDPYLLKDGSTYYLYVEDKEDVPFRDIRCYTSSDFSTWTDQGEVLGPTGSGWESTDVSSPVVWIDGITWYMLYEGRKTTDQFGAIGLATSSDGLSWTRNGGNPVLVGQNATYSYAGPVSWANAISPDDIRKIGATYVLSFHASRLTGDNTNFRTGIATSTNLTTWTDAIGDPVACVAAPDGSVMFNPTPGTLYFIYVMPGDGIVMAEEGAGDSNWSSVKLYVSGYEYDASTRFYDISESWHLDTAVGNVQIDNAQSKWGPSSILFDGSGDRITYAHSADWDFGSGPFTIRLWARFAATETAANVFCSQYATASRAFAFDYFNNTIRFSYSTNGTATAATLTFAWTQSGSTWFHFEITRDSSGDVRAFVDGVQIGSTQAANVTIFNSTDALWVGAISTATPGNDFAGHMEGLEIIKGVALHTANFTPPSAPHTIGPVP